MKKILLICVGLILIATSIQVFLGFGGGLLGVVRKAQSLIYTQASIMSHDAGKCASIGDYPGEGRTEYLRDKCVAKFTRKIQKANDCGTLDFITSKETLGMMDLSEYYRQSCLINHYKRMLGNNLVKEWIPEACIGLTDKLIILSHYLAEMRPFVGTSDIVLQPYEFLPETDIRSIEKCEKMLDTPRIYSFLRGEGTAEEEKNYIESQKIKFQKEPK